MQLDHLTRADLKDRIASAVNASSVESFVDKSDLDISEYLVQCFEALVKISDAETGINLATDPWIA